MIYCDNWGTVEVINANFSRNVPLQSCLRELHKLQALHSFELKTLFLRGVDNHLPDLLSRWYNGQKYRDQFAEITDGWELQQSSVEDEMWEFLQITDDD